MSAEAWAEVGHDFIFFLAAPHHVAGVGGVAFIVGVGFTVLYVVDLF